MKPSNLIEQINVEIKKLYKQYNTAISSNDYDKALVIGIEIIEKLLNTTDKYVISNLSNPSIKEIAKGIVSYHEKTLAYVKGTREALKTMPLIYSFDAKEKAIESLTTSINGLFSFLLGSLVVLADILSSAGSNTQKEDKSTIPRVV
ncbi:MAG: hypothetical protein B6U94_01300 [Thermofilum sp. ex4484_79]|nr:MAG: hypothetical protein B6U94_01300 [Thermofilum sp. ex4484_79]